MLRREDRQFLQRLPPALLRLVRQPRNQIKTDVPNPSLAQNRHRPVNIRPPVLPPRRNQFLVHKRLHPKTNPVNPGPHPSLGLFPLDCLRVRLQRNLHQIFTNAVVGAAFQSGPLAKRSSNRIQNALQVPRIQQTRRPSANVNRVNSVSFLSVKGAFRLPCSSCGGGRFPHSTRHFVVSVYGRSPPRRTPQTPRPIRPRRPQQLPMSPNLSANRLHIRRKSATSHHPRMKITIGTLRLAERHLHVNPNLPHHPKTLAHPAPNPARSAARLA